MTRSYEGLCTCGHHHPGGHATCSWMTPGKAYTCECPSFELAVPVGRSPEDIVRALAAEDPGVPSEVDGSLSCFFCGAWNRPSDPDIHGADCPWRMAREWTSANGEIG